MRTAGFVLVGGSSSRMGRDKALLAIGSQVLVQRIAQAVGEVADSVTLVGSPHRYRQYEYNRLADVRAGCGPLGGLEAALASEYAAELNLVVSCDLPDLQASLLRELIRSAESSDSMCVAAQDPDGQLHPLCAVYRKTSLPVIVAALDEGERRMLVLLQRLGAQAVQAARPVSNINTPEDWAVWRPTC